MKVKHVALAVKKSDVKDFYSDVLGFESIRNFTVSGADASKIFGILGSVEVEMMHYDGIEFELFISNCSQFITYTHLCLELSMAGKIYKKALDAGYSGLERSNGNKSTWFVRDKSGNLFELKAQ